jgi:hypothetical protein
MLWCNTCIKERKGEAGRGEWGRLNYLIVTKNLGRRGAVFRPQGREGWECRWGGGGGYVIGPTKGDLQTHLAAGPDVDHPLTGVWNENLRGRELARSQQHRSGDAGFVEYLRAFAPSGRREVSQKGRLGGKYSQSSAKWCLVT